MYREELRERIRQELVGIDPSLATEEEIDGQELDYALMLKSRYAASVAQAKVISERALTSAYRAVWAQFYSKWQERERELDALIRELRNGRA